jgi:pimeloyl-ACP methyl ester carboxylesterase
MVISLADIQLKTVVLDNGETIGYRERLGGDEVLILIHGNMTSSKHWDVLLEAFDPFYTLYALDLRGFGISTYHTSIDSIKDFSDDVKAFMDAIGLEKASLLGWSTGGAVSMQFAIDYPERVKRLILLASASTRGYPFYQIGPNGEKRRIAKKADIAVDPGKTLPILSAYRTKNKAFLKELWNSLIYTNEQPSTEKYEEYLEDMLTQQNLVDVYHALNTFNISTVHNGVKEGTGKAKDIKAPTLVLWGENDLVVTEQMTNEILEDLGENAEFELLLECGHSPLIDNLEQLLEKITSFLQKV